ncbi:MAG TPA: hypothetical protein VFO83_05680, partial [Aggregicoccus sp.]|nr:hypothetical protein [Aggregicoccus sp.]
MSTLRAMQLRPDPSQDFHELGGLLLRALPPLHRQVRAPMAAALAQRLSRLATLQAGVPSHAPVALLQEALARLESEVAEVDAEIARFTRRYSEASSSASRRAVLVAHIEETVSDLVERRKDLRALHRWLGFDALRERLEKRRHRLQLEEETALLCLAGLLRTGKPEEGALLPPASEALGRTLLALAGRSARPQNQLAAVQALRELVEARPELRAPLQEPGAALIGLVEQEAASPFLRAEALRVLLRLEPEGGRLLMRRRLQAPFPPGRDFLFRREALELIAPLLPEEQLLSLLQSAARTDPSEYVRMAVCTLALRVPGGLPLLFQLAGLAPQAPEPSARVRASAVLAATAALREGAPEGETL